MTNSRNTYGHTPIESMFERGDVYGIAYDEARAKRVPIRMGIIGAGGVAQSKYLPAVQRLRTIWEPLQVTAVTTLDKQQAEKVAALYGCNTYSDHKTMLAGEKLDAILIASPDDYHYEHAMDSLKSGKHVLIEKAMTRSLVQSEEICKEAEKRSLVCMAVANKRFSPPYFRAKEALSLPGLSNPALFSGKFNLGYDYVQFLEGGTIHIFDIARYLMGDVKELYAIGVNRYSRNAENYLLDNVVITLKFASGAVGTLTSSSTALSLKPWERVEVYGNGTWLAVDDQYKLTIYDGEEKGAQSWTPIIPNTLIFDEEFGGYMGLVEHFIQVIRGTEKPLLTGWDGHRALELVIATHLSLKHEKPIQLPLSCVEADSEYHSLLGTPKATLKV